MTPAKDQVEITSSAKTDLMASVWTRIREHLENERHRINEEIRHYPTPIPACDAQFNYLLEERVRIPEELKRLEALSTEALTQKELINSLDQFIAASNYISGEVEQKIRACLLD
jgi:hypothetical protein